MSVKKFANCVVNGCSCSFHQFDFPFSDIDDLEYYALLHEGESGLCNLALGIISELNPYPKVNGIIIPYYQKAINMGTEEAYWYLYRIKPFQKFPDNIKTPPNGIIYLSLLNPRKIDPKA